MTGRPLDPDCRRNPVYLALILVLVMVAVLLAAGCISDTGNEKVTNKVSVIVPSSSITNRQTPCPLSVNKTPHIIINPISNFTLGDIFEITGTTNLGESEKIHYYVYSAFIPTPKDVPEPKYYVTSGDIQIVRNDCKVKAWSFVVDSNNFTTWSDVFYVNIWTNNWSSPESVKNSTMILTHRKVSGRPWGEVR